MPIDLEMLLSATTHPLFAYSPFADERFSVASSYADDYRHGLASPQNNFLLGSRDKQLEFVQKQPIFESYYNLKSKNDSSEELPYCPPKKKVSFADDRGLNLVEVREIPEAPKWADNVLNLLIGGMKRSVVREKKWKVSYEHPPWENEKFLQFLNKNKVALESIFVKEGTEDILSGTIKVVNVAYEKNVFLRITFDRWLSYTDISAIYIQPEDATTRNEAYDTFSFSAKIPPTASKYDVIEFCVCFQCNGWKYWDNNRGINYRLIADSSKCNSVPDAAIGKGRSAENKVTLTENLEKFSEIDLWNGFMHNRPHW